MRHVRRTVSMISMVVLMLLCGTSVVAGSTQPAQLARVASARTVDASGTFTASVFFDTLVTRDVGKGKCEFVVDGQLTFEEGGTLVGVAEGTTTALIDAPCAEATNPANVGAFRDVFRFEGTFSGTVDGVPVTGDLTYAGVTRPGGSIDANIKLRADRAQATLHTVTAQLGVGGTYRGVVVTKE